MTPSREKDPQLGQSSRPSGPSSKLDPMPAGEGWRHAARWADDWHKLPEDRRKPDSGPVDVLIQLAFALLNGSGFQVRIRGMMEWRAAMDWLAAQLGDGPPESPPRTPASEDRWLGTPVEQVVPMPGLTTGRAMSWADAAVGIAPLLARIEQLTAGPQEADDARADPAADDTDDSDGDTGHLARLAGGLVLRRMLCPGTALGRACVAVLRCVTDGRWRSLTLARLRETVMGCTCPATLREGRPASALPDKVTSVAVIQAGKVQLLSTVLVLPGLAPLLADHVDEARVVAETLARWEEQPMADEPDPDAPEPDATTVPPATPVPTTPVSRNDRLPPVPVRDERPAWQKADEAAVAAGGPDLARAVRAIGVQALESAYRWVSSRRALLRAVRRWRRLESDLP